MIIKDREEFIKYFDDLLIENGIREICERCNNGEFRDSYNRKGCCMNCEYLGEDGCLNRNTSCLIASCSIIRKLNSPFHYYLSVIELNPKFKINHRRDAGIEFPIRIPKFPSHVNWMKRYNRVWMQRYPDKIEPRNEKES